MDWRVVREGRVIRLYDGDRLVGSSIPSEAPGLDEAIKAELEALKAEA